MNILVTGITGFCGATLSNILIGGGNKVYGLIRKTNGLETDLMDTISQEDFDKITFLHADIKDFHSLQLIFQKYKFDCCYHLAANSHPPSSFINPLDTFETNVMGSANLIEAIRLYNPECKLMFTSTSEVYGNSGKDGHIIKEDEKLAPSNPYGTSKASIDLLMQERMSNGFIKGFIVRPFSYTGIRRGKNFSISSDAYQVSKILKGRQEPILEVGNLETTRVVMDVGDTAAAMVTLMENEDSCGNVYNICGDVPRKMRFFTDYLIELSGLDIQKEMSEKYYRPIDIQCQIGDCSKLKALTGWEAKIPIEKTLEDLLNYWIKKIS